MKILRTLLLCSAIIMNPIESSSQSKRMPDGGPIPGFHRREPFPSSAGSSQCTATTHSLTPPNFTASSPTLLRERSRSPTLSHTFSSVLGFSFEDLANIRLTPHNNPNQVFELRRYVFPSEKEIGLRTRSVTLNLIPHEEQIVLSTSDGDVCAILEKAINRATNIRALYKSVLGRSERVKINMDSGVVKKLTADERMECPSTANGRIVKSYGVSRFGNTNHSVDNPIDSATSPTPAEPRLREFLSSPTLRETFPRVLGHSFGELPYIRLAPLTDTNRILELQIYVFPSDKPIRLRTRTHILIPMPTEQQIVLLTTNGDICAILEKGSRRQTFIRAMFTPVFGMAERAKININSGVVEVMNAEEIAGCPLSSKVAITETYSVYRIEDGSETLE